MQKVYLYIGIGLIISWTAMWFAVKGTFRSLEKGESSKFIKMFIPKDFDRDIEMIERQAQRKKREEERKRREAELQENSDEE